MASVDPKLVYEQLRWSFDVKVAQWRGQEQRIATIGGATGVVMGLLVATHRSGDTSQKAMVIVGLILGIVSLFCAVMAYTTRSFSITIPLHPKHGAPATSYEAYLGVDEPEALQGWGKELAGVLLSGEFQRAEKARGGWFLAQTTAAALTLIPLFLLSLS